jgi:predicted Zn-dependent protease
MNRADQALEMVQRARKIDGVSPLFALLEGRYQFHARRFKVAGALFRQLIDAHPDNEQYYFGLADVLAAQGQFNEALEVRKAAHTLADDEELNDVLADAKGESGYRAVERATVQLVELPSLERRNRRGEYASPMDFARAYAQLGDSVRTRKFLDEAISERAAAAVLLNVDRAWDAVRGESWFNEALRTLALTA